MQLKCEVVNEGKTLGYLVIDSFVREHACGGVRMSPNLTVQEVALLARTMTWKYAIVGLRCGGAKAGVIGNPETSEQGRRELVADFGRAIAPLLRKRVYIAGPDIGISDDDIAFMYAAAGVHPSSSQRRALSSAHCTAVTVFESLKEAARFRGCELRCCTAAIEGFGRVGQAVADLLRTAGVKLVAVSTSAGAVFSRHGLDPDKIKQEVRRWGAEGITKYTEADRISREQLLELPVDVLVPCAGMHSIHERNAPRISCRVFCPAANCPITDEADFLLWQRGITSLPDFVTNCGGVLGGAMQANSVRPYRAVASLQSHVGAYVRRLLRDSARFRVRPRELALKAAELRSHELRQATAQSNIVIRAAADLAQLLHLQGRVPGIVAEYVCETHLRRNFRNLVLDHERVATMDALVEERVA